MTSRAAQHAMTSAVGTINLLVRLIGEGAAMRIMDGKNLGGARFRFPKSECGLGAQAFAYLAEIVGMDKAKILCQHFGGDDIYIPKMTHFHIQEQHRRIVRAYNGGASIRELVREFELSDRHIWRVLKNTDMSELPNLGKSPQANLFE